MIFLAAAWRSDFFERFGIVRAGPGSSEKSENKSNNYYRFVGKFCADSAEPTAVLRTAEKPKIAREIGTNSNE